MYKGNGLGTSRPESAAVSGLRWVAQLRHPLKPFPLIVQILPIDKKCS